MTWRKNSPFKWYREEPNAVAAVTKVSGNGPWPYMWDVYPLPRPQVGRWTPIAKGSERRLSDAKAKADQAITGKPHPA